MTKLFIEDLPLKGKKVLMRVDFNVPLDGDQRITDTTRIEAALPSIQYVLKQGGSLILMSHLGRPHHSPEPELSLLPVAKMLEGLLNQPVKMPKDCIGREVKMKVDNLKPGEVLLLENLRFHRAEEYPEEAPDFAKELASYGDFYVNDAFGTAHRKHSSTYTIAQYFPGKAAAGYLMEKEIRFLGEVLKNPQRPFCALIGGAKISSKIGVIKSLLKRVDSLLIGGGMAFTFLKAKGMEIGNSICERDLIPLAKEILNLCEKSQVKIQLPVDFIAAKKCSDDAEARTVDATQGIPDGFEGLDIGQKTIDLFSKAISQAKTLLWNGPVGVFEFERFAKGTFAIAKAVADSSATSIVGGGDSVAAINQSGFQEKITHISTGGGATLEYIEFGTLPGIEALSDKSAAKQMT